MTPGRIVLLLMAALPGVTGMARAAEPADTAGIHPIGEFVLTPQPADWSLITDCTTGYALAVENPNAERFMFTDGLGVMRNLGGGHALGASLDLHITGPGVRTGATVRYRRSLAEQRAVELSLGYVPGHQSGISGMAVQMRYRPTREFYVQVGAFRNRIISESYSYSPASGYVHTVDERAPVRVTAGFGFDGVPGRVLWGVQALVVAVLYGGYFIAGAMGVGS